MFFFTPREMMKIGIQTSLVMAEAQRLFALQMLAVWRVTPQRPETSANDPEALTRHAPDLALRKAMPMPEKAPPYCARYGVPRIPM